MKRIFYILAGIVFMMPHAAHTSGMDFEEFAITDTTDVDIMADAVSLNSGAWLADVGAFDIAGVYLGMPFEDVQTLFFKTHGLYAPREKNAIVYTMHPDWKYNLDYECRQNGTYIPAELEKCINTLARNKGVMFASEVHLVRENTGETLTLYFTSNATDNLVWRVLYNNDVNEVEGDNPKFANQREKKILNFWQNVLDKYGAPNSGTDKWISSTNAYDPMMVAYYGSLDLVDKGRYATDAAKNVSQSREHFQAKPYTF